MMSYIYTLGGSATTNPSMKQKKVSQQYHSKLPYHFVLALVLVRVLAQRKALVLDTPS